MPDSPCLLGTVNRQDLHTLVEAYEVTIGEGLVAFFSGADVTDEAVANYLLDLFVEAHSAERWLACNCANRGDKGYPILYLGITDAEKAYVQLPPKDHHRTPHDANCTFLTRIRRGRSRIGNCVKPTRTPLTSNADFAVVGAFARGRSESARSHTRGGALVKTESARERRPTLSLLMFTLFERAGINRIARDIPRPNLTQQYKDIAQAAAQITLVKGVSVGSLLETYPPRLTDLRNKIVAAEKNWPSVARRPQGFFLSMVREISDQKLHFYPTRNKLYPTEYKPPAHPQALVQRPHVFAEYDNYNRAPYVALVSLAKIGPGYARPYGIGCYAQPCYKRSDLFPVDSRLESDALDAIIEWREMAAKTEIGFDIWKPLFDITTASGDLCLPDFVLENFCGKDLKARRLAIEVMGIQGDEYLAGKKITHPRMRDEFEFLVQFDGLMADRDEARKKFWGDLRGVVDYGRQPKYETLINA